jgi:tetratricopeptide (TPR) repeat protein
MTKMTMGYKVFINCTRNAIIPLPPEVRKAAALKEVKMFVISKALRRGIYIDKNIPDVLVSEEMAERYLEITPPVYSLIIPDYQSIADEIEQSYVIGNDFSAISASCVVIERLLNKARIDLHEHHKDEPVKELWNKDAVPAWSPNIGALKKWGYLDDNFESELSYIYEEIRCRYLHSREIQNMRQDAKRAIDAAYKLMKIFIGFPEDLFDGVTCKNEADPKFLAFYKPYLQDIELTDISEKYEENDMRNPKNYLVFTNWGCALSLLAKLRNDDELFKQACQKFEQAIKYVSIEYEKFPIYYNWGVALAEWAKLKGDEKLFEQANEKFEQAIRINPTRPDAYDNWAGIFIHWSKLKRGTPEFENLLKKAEEKGLKAESLRKGSSAYRLAKIYAIRNDKENCKKWLLVGHETGTLPTREQAMKDNDLDSIKNELWFTEIKWKGEK